jgi:hypothetical protein
MDPVPDLILLRRCGSAGNRTRTYVSVARSSDHWTAEAVTVNSLDLHQLLIANSLLTLCETKGKVVPVVN